MELESLAVKLEEENDRLLKEKVVSCVRFLFFCHEDAFMRHATWHFRLLFFLKSSQETMSFADFSVLDGN